MRGEVEIWRGDELVLQEANMLTDGAGKLIADIMTVSPSLDTVSDPGTQAILDASNYVIQSISFGTASKAFSDVGFGRGLDQLKASYLSGPGAYTQYLAGEINTIAVANRDDADNTNFNYPTNTLFPETPDPMRRVLENGTSISSVPGQFFGEETPTSISSLFPGNGQHVNFMPSVIREYVTLGTELSGSLSSFYVGSLMGSYPAGVSEQGDTGSRLVYRNPNEALGITLTVGSYPNEASSMDVSGFITSVTGTDTQLGLTTSSNADFSSNGTVEYSTTLSQDDLAYLQLFGGIYHMGLWTIDMKKSLLAGNTPPFGFSVLDNPRKYRLFCRKGVSKDLTITSNVQTRNQDLTIKWRLHFL